MLNTMALMKYDVLNLSPQELRFGVEFTRQACTGNPFTCLASNLLYQGSSPPWAKQYILEDNGDLKIAFIGIIDPEDELLKSLVSLQEADDLQVAPPETVLNRLLPAVRDKADVIILFLVRILR